MTQGLATKGYCGRPDPKMYMTVRVAVTVHTVDALAFAGWLAQWYGMVWD